MPELPEVETTRLALEPYLAGQRIAELTIRRRDLRWPIPEGLENTLKGKRIRALRRVGKYMLIDLANDLPSEQGEARSVGVTGGGFPLSLIAHLGMSGSYRISPALPNTIKTHDHLLLRMESGVTAIYHDPRRFGFLLPCPTATLANHPLLAKMGMDPLDEKAFTGTALYTALKSRKTAVKLAIMDQHLIAGVGNIYASEALFLAQLHPERAASSLTLKECNALQLAITAVLRAALASGGSTLRDYVSGENVSGYFQHQFQVYDRAGEACAACGHPVQKLTQSGRATYYCATCQPAKPAKK